MVAIYHNSCQIIVLGQKFYLTFRSEFPFPVRHLYSFLFWLLKKKKNALIFEHCVAVQSFICVGLIVTPWNAVRQASLFFTISESLLKFMSFEVLMPYNLLILCHPFLLPSIFPMGQLFASGGQSIGASASALVISMNIQG